MTCSWPESPHAFNLSFESLLGLPGIPPDSLSISISIDADGETKDIAIPIV